MRDLDPVFVSSFAKSNKIDENEAIQRLKVLSCATERDTHAPSKNMQVVWSDDVESENLYREIFQLLWPHEIEGRQKIHVGGSGDGSYTILESTPPGLVVSAGISTWAPFDLEIAQKGFTVWQFDGTIEKSPVEHPNVIFFKNNIGPVTDIPKSEICLSDILSQAEYQKDIILRMDIEGAEWRAIEDLDESEMMRFSQIATEFHNLTNTSGLGYYKKVFNKICATHVPINLHYNNNYISPVLGFKNFLVSNFWEITFVRRNLGRPTKLWGQFPCTPDTPNHKNIPEIYIGNMAAITGTPNPFLPTETLGPELEKLFSEEGSIPVIPAWRGITRPPQVHNSKREYENAQAALATGEFRFNGDALNQLMEAQKAFPWKGKDVAIIGLDGCNLDALAFFWGAHKIYVCAEEAPVCDDDRIISMTSDEFASSEIRVDILISVNQLSHCGLGRYGDPVDPVGDIKALNIYKRRLKLEGLLFLSIPIGQDCVCWNAHRIYGLKRIRKILDGWTFLSSFGINDGSFKKEIGGYTEAFLILTPANNAVHIPSYATKSAERQIHKIASSFNFNRNFYIGAYPESLIHNMDLVSHFVLLGAHKGFNPNPDFNTLLYSKINNDIDRERINPFYHFLQTEEGNNLISERHSDQGVVPLDDVTITEMQPLITPCSKNDIAVSNKNHGIILTANFIMKKDALSHVNRCFILATGPTLNKIDLTKFENEIVIGVNNLLYKDFTPTFLCASTPTVFDDNVNPGYLKIAAESDCKFVLASRIMKSTLEGGKIPAHKIAKIYDLRPRLPRFVSLYEGDLDSTVPMESVVGDIAIPLAVYLGIKKIYLIGMDGYHNPRTADNLHCYEGSNHDTPSNRNYIVSHQKTAQVWFGKIDVLARLQGVEIYNLTPGSAISAFERVNVLKFFHGLIRSEIVEAVGKCILFRDRILRILPGNNGNSQTCSLFDPLSNTFIRHQNGKIIFSQPDLASALFNADSSFYAEISFIGARRVSFRSANSLCIISSRIVIQVIIS